MENRKVLLSVDNLHVNFKVRGRTLSAIRGISLDFYENESVAIVGESGSGKSVFTKTFAGMLETNGYISEGSIIFNDEELADTTVKLNGQAKSMIANAWSKLNQYAQLEHGAEIYKQILELESERKAKGFLSQEEEEAFDTKLKDLNYRRTELYNQKLTVDTRKEKARLKELTAQINDMDAEINAVTKLRKETIAANKKSLKNNVAYQKDYDAKKAALKASYEQEIQKPISDETKDRNEIIAKEI